MIEQRTRRSSSAAPEVLAWSEKPGVWLALSIGCLLVSVPWWIEGLADGRGLSLVAAAVCTAAAVAAVVHARRCARADPAG